jgi:hypothetical protein
MTLAPTPEVTETPPTETPNPTTQPTTTQAQPPNPTITPTQKPTATTYPSPTENPSPTIIPATTDNGATVNLEISGNITSSQISNLTITTNQSTASTAIDFTITGEKGNSGLGIITIPKSAIPFGTDPVIYIDNELASNSGFMQDEGNFYVWFATEFSTHQMTIQFVLPPTAQASSVGSLLAIAIAVASIISIYTLIAIEHPRRRLKNIQQH